MSTQNLSSSSEEGDVYKGEKYDPPYANEPDSYRELRRKQSLKNLNRKNLKCFIQGHTLFCDELTSTSKLNHAIGFRPLSYISCIECDEL